MKKKINISTLFIVIVVLIIVGIFCLYNGVHISYEYEHAVDVKDLEPNDIEEGMYIMADITSYVYNGMSGVSSSDIELALSNDTYTIAMGENHYIRILTKNEKMKKELNAIYADKKYNGEPVHFVGKVFKTDGDISYEWYEKVDKSLYPNLGNIVADYAIQEADADSGKDIIIAGVTFIAIFLILYGYMGGVKNGIIKEEYAERDEKYLSPYAGSLNNENELYSEQMYLKFLENEKLDLKKKLRFRLVLLCVSVTLQVMSAYLNILLIVLIVYSLYGLWCCFLHSENRLAIIIVKRYNIRSNSLELAKCKNNIFELNSMIEMGNRLRNM